MNCWIFIVDKLNRLSLALLLSLSMNSVVWLDLNFPLAV